ncbi:ATP-binding protein [Shewanella indica]|uniref:ATP-binding protein n=2 Tax=Shewanella indica TaxID=768528 RepID=UPI0035E717FF
MPKDLERYAARMGLWDVLDRPAPVSIGRAPARGRFAEARRVTADDQVHGVSVELSSMFHRTRGVTPATIDAIQIMLSELLGNSCAHSRRTEVDQVFGVTIGQSWAGGNLAQLCIVDCGMGIRSSLSQNAQLGSRLASENACQIATEYGVTGKPFGPHSGYGLTFTNDLTSQNGGCLIVISGNECYSNRCGVVSTSVLPNFWDGTIVIFEWNTNVSLDARRVYDGWPDGVDMEEELDYGDIFN